MIDGVLGMNRVWKSALVASVILFTQGSIAQQEDKVHQGYYFWDFEYSGGDYLINALPADAPEPRSGDADFDPKYSFRKSRIAYSWDFCGAIPFFFTMGAESTRFNRATLPVNNPVEGEEPVPNIGGVKDRAYFASLGLRIRVSRAADLYGEGGYIEFDEDYPSIILGAINTQFGGSSPEREAQLAFLEIGVRARTGASGNWEFNLAVKETELFGAEGKAGIRYHSAAGFSVGFFYKTGGQPKALTTLTDTGETVSVVDEAGDPVLDEAGNPVMMPEIITNSSRFQFGQSAAVSIRFNI